ncbi:MAG: hypothetical protein M3Z06_01750 [Actinomycetota bacterium]|nr:hypothetical protein [Actinomycetota bacterium]
MTIWWIGVIVFVAVVLPVVVLVLQRLLRPALQIKALADDIAPKVGLFAPHIADAVSELATTQRLVAQVRPELERYGRTLERLS